MIREDIPRPVIIVCALVLGTIAGAVAFRDRLKKIVRLAHRRGLTLKR